MSVMKALGVSNPLCIDHTLAAGATVALTFSAEPYTKGVNTVEIGSDVDTFVTVKFGGTAPAAGGTNTVPVLGYTKFIPAYGFQIFSCEQKATSVSVKNASAGSNALKINGYVTEASIA